MLTEISNTELNIVNIIGMLPRYLEVYRNEHHAALAELSALRTKLAEMGEQRRLDCLCREHDADCRQMFYDELVKLGVAECCETHGKNCEPHVVATVLKGIEGLQAKLSAAEAKIHLLEAEKREVE